MGSRGLAAALLALLVTLPATSLAEPAPAPPPAPAPDSASRDRRWTEGTFVRLDLGPVVGMYLSLGFEARAEWQLWSWRYGEVGVGGIVATHFDWVDDPGLPLEHAEVSGTDVLVTIAPTVGHTFRFWGRRIGIATHLVAGASVRVQQTELRDEAHGIEESHGAAAAVAFLGLGASVGVRITDHVGLNVHGVVPLLGTSSLEIIHMWEMAKPYGGISLSVFL